MKSEPGPPMTLGNAAAARVRLIVWCKDCRHQIEPDPAEMASRRFACSASGCGMTNRCRNGRADYKIGHIGVG